MRGEYSPLFLLSVLSEGSPPLTRGVQRGKHWQKSTARITPAYAGSTKDGNGHRSGSQDHPRLRGEYKSWDKPKQSALGSPPLARGVLSADRRTYGLPRITPAYAGSTFDSPFDDSGKQDHPRLRGEYSHSRKWRMIISGSPPLTRGVPRHVQNVANLQGITPAYAGSTLKKA